MELRLTRIQTGKSLSFLFFRKEDFPITPDWSETLAAFGVAAAFFTLMGWPLARLLAAPFGIAPALGWAVFNALALPVLTFTGFGRLTASTLCIACLAGAVYALRRTQAGGVRLPPWALVLAGCVALLPLIAIMPKDVEGGLLLGPPMFDHVKIAIVDSVLREGLPVHNPFIGGDGPSPLAYYYLWHFSAAVLGACFSIGGWPADAAMTGATAWASLLLMMEVAVWVSGRVAACWAVGLLALPASLRPLLDAVLGRDTSGRVLARDADLGGWLDQAAWVPQHLASACCAIVAVLLMPSLAGARPRLAAVVLGVVVAAGFESSTWIGGVAFAVAGPLAGLVAVLCLPRSRRAPFFAWAALAALVAGLLVLPFVLAQFAAVAGRHGPPAVAWLTYPTLGSAVPAGWRSALDLPAFWLVALPFGVPVMALSLAGLPSRHTRAAWPLAAFAVACLAVAWLLRSMIDNNDLGWRAVLPAVLVLTSLASSGLIRLATSRRWSTLAACLGLAALGLPGLMSLAGGYVFGQRPGSAAAFARSAAAWDALRRVAAPAERIANNPKLAALSTPWPVNIAWALLSDRPSCYSQWETVLAYGALTRRQLDDANARVERVFDGHAEPGDVAILASRYGCHAVLLTPADGAWQDDPFAASPDYAPAAHAAQWRIYKRR